MTLQLLRSKQTLVTGGLMAAFCFTGAAFAQTVTVDAALATPDGENTFNTLHEAVASFADGGINAGDSAENIININAATPVIDEVNADMEFTTPMVIQGGMTIQGDGGLAVLAGTPLTDDEQILRTTNAPDPQVLPCFAWRQAGELTIRNVAFIPTDPNMRGLVVVKSPSSNADLVANIENCVFTANDGTNHPLIITGREAAPDTTAAGVIALADNGDAFWGFSRAEQGDLTLNFNNTVFGSFGVPSADNNGDAIIAFMNGDTSNFINCYTNVNEGCVFSNITGRAVQNTYGSLANINGTEANPVVFTDITAGTVIFNYSDASGVTQPTACTVNHARFYNVSGNAISENRARGFIATVSNSIIANAGSDGIFLNATGTLPADGEATQTVTLDNVTIHNAGSGSTPGCVYAGAINRDLVVTNSIMTGAGKNGVVYNGTGTCTISDSILSLEGDNALAAQTAGSGNIVVEPSVTSQAVTYVNMDDPFSPDFFKVVGSDVRDWSVY